MVIAGFLNHQQYDYEILNPHSSTPLKTNGWIPKNDGLEEMYGPFKYGHFCGTYLKFEGCMCFFFRFQISNRNFGISSHQIDDSPSRSDGIWDNSMQHLAPEGLMIRSSVNFGA